MSEIISIVGVVFSLVILESLLSVDNALVLAAMVNHLPDQQRSKALRYGLIGAYVMRFASIGLIAFIISNPWLKLIGGGYLLYLMCSHLGVAEEGEGDAHNAVNKGFWATVIAVEIADMTFSLDNIVAAAAFSPKLWVVLLGVGIGILAMRFVAGIFTKLIDKFPILAQVAYVLVGSIGVQLIAEHSFGLHLNEVQKLGSVLGIVAFGMIYAKVPLLQKGLGPTFRWLGQVMGNISELIDSLLVPVKLVFHYTVGVTAVFLFGLLKRAYNAAPAVTSVISGAAVAALVQYALVAIFGIALATPGLQAAVVAGGAVVGFGVSKVAAKIFAEPKNGNA
jgi:tellurite resistance protein TerC